MSMLKSGLTKSEFFLITIISLILLIPVFQKMEVERSMKFVELAYSTNGVLQMSALSGLPVRDVMSQLKLAGVSSIIIPEDTLSDLIHQGRLSMQSGAEVLNHVRELGTTGGGLISRLPANYVINTCN